LRLSRGEWLWLPVTLAALLLIYLPGLGNPPLFDDEILTDGEIFQQYRSLQMRTRMLSYGSFVWVQALFGDGWWKQRLVNLAIHAAVVVALWAFYREILRHIEAPRDEGVAQPRYHESPALGVAIGFFALNPVAVYGVAYLVQRSILLATLFVVLGLWLFARGVAEKKPWMHPIALACYALAVLSKEHAILAPLIAIPVYVIVARPRARALATAGALGVLFVAATGAFLLLRFGEIIGKPFDEYSHVYLEQLSRLDPNAVGNAYPLSILNEAYLFFHYGLRWFLPWEGWMSINLRPPFPLTFTSFPQMLGIAGYAATLAGGFFLLRFRDWRALVGLSLLMPALLFGSEFATVWVQDPFVLYRSYLWAIGVPGLVLVLTHGPSGRVLAVIGLAVGALLVWQSIDRVLSMRTPEDVWTDAIRKLPNDTRSVGRWFPYLNRGAAYVERDQFNLAIPDFQKSASLGDMGMGAANLGSILSAKGRHREALAALDTAERQGYKLYGLHFQRGLALANLGRLQEAYAQFEKAWSMSPPSPAREAVLVNMGRTALQLQNRTQAVLALEFLIGVDPKHREGRYLLAMAYIQVGSPDRALLLLDSLIRDAPAASAYYARALANYELKRKAAALGDLDNAQRMGGLNAANLREWRAKIEALP
jgi:hypothetical protein